MKKEEKPKTPEELLKEEEAKEKAREKMVANLKNKLDLLFAEFGLKDYILCLKLEYGHILNIGNFEPEDLSETLEVMGSINHAGIHLGYGFMEIVPDEMLEMMMSKIVAEKRMHENAFVGLREDVEMMEESMDEDEDDSNPGNDKDDGDSKLRENLNPDKDD